MSTVLPHTAAELLEEIERSRVVLGDITLIPDFAIPHGDGATCLGVDIETQWAPVLPMVLASIYAERSSGTRRKPRFPDWPRDGSRREVHGDRQVLYWPGITLRTDDTKDTHPAERLAS